MIRKAYQSDFLKGQNKKAGQHLSIGLSNQRIFEKVISGNYDNKNRANTQQCNRDPNEFLRNIARESPEPISRNPNGECSVSLSIPGI